MPILPEAPALPGRRLCRRKLLLMCLACASWAVGFGWGSQVVSHWLQSHGHSDTAIGLAHTAYYLGLALGAPLVPALLGRWGRACPLLGMTLAGVTLALFPWGGSLGGYLILRLLNGAAGALSLIPLETFISHEAAPDERTRCFGWYGVALRLGGALGIWAGLHFHEVDGSLAFLLGGLLPIAVASALGGCVSTFGGADEPLAARQPLFKRRNVLSFGTAWC